METLFKKHRMFISQTQTDIVRDMINHINWSKPLVAIKGSRGVGKTTGDFRIDGRYTIEVGGDSKSFDQIADVPDSYVLADSMEYPIGKKLPIWLVGLTY